MNQDHLWKIIGGVVTLLLALTCWLIKDEVAGVRAELAGLKAANTAQWKSAADTRDCFQQRLSHLEGWHDCEKLLREKK